MEDFKTDIVDMLRGHEGINHHLNSIANHMEYYHTDPEGYKNVILHTLELIRGQYNKSLPLIQPLRQLERNELISFNGNDLTVSNVKQGE